MGWLAKLLTGGGLGVIDKLVGRFTGDRTAREAGYHDESMESHREFAAEFQVTNRTKFDSLIDGQDRQEASAGKSASIKNLLETSQDGCRAI